MQNFQVPVGAATNRLETEIDGDNALFIWRHQDHNSSSENIIVWKNKLVLMNRLIITGH